MKKRILLFGAQGLLGYDLFQTLSEDFEMIPFSRFNLNLFQTEEIQPLVQKLAPDIVVNAAAFTDTEKAENPVFEDDVLILNVEAPLQMAQACQKIGAIFVNFSTDFVFDGEAKSYSEDAAKNPLNFYGFSKSKAEDAILEACEQAIIIRTAWLFGENGLNFVQKILTLAKQNKPLQVVDDLFVSMTYTKDLAEAVRQLLLLPQREHRVYHLVNEGEYSLYEIAEMILKAKGLQRSIKAVSSEQFSSVIKRPKRALLQNNRAEKLRPLPEALQDFIN